MKKLFLMLCVFVFMACENETKNIIPESETKDAVETRSTEGEVSDNLLAFHSDRTVLRWTAYKNPEKIAVQGTFDSIVVRNTNESLIPEDVLEGATFNITTSSMTTGDLSRDSKILSLFFNNLDSRNIIGIFGKFEDGNVPVKITLNNIEVEKTFQYTFENKKIIITGVVDIIEDFRAQKGFDILHEACAALHLDKTWTDVSIEVISDLEKPRS